MNNRRVLIVDDEILIALNLQMLLEESGYETDVAISAEEAIRLAADRKPDLIIMDIALKGGGSGLEATKEIQSRRAVPVIFMTGNSDIVLKNLDASKPQPAVLSKPTPGWKLLEAIETVLG